MRDDSGRDGKTKALRFLVQFSKQDPRFSAGSSGVWVHADPLHRARVDNDAAITRGVAGEAVATPAHGGEKIVLSGERHGGFDMGDFRTSDNERRPAVDGPIPHSPMHVVAMVARSKDLSSRQFIEAIDGCGWD